MGQDFLNRQYALTSDQQVHSGSKFCTIYNGGSVYPCGGRPQGAKHQQLAVSSVFS